MNKIESQPQRLNQFHVAFNGAMLQFLNQQLMRHRNDFDSLPPEVKRHFSRSYETRNSAAYRPEHLTIYRIQQPQTDEARYSIMRELGIDFEAYLKHHPVRVGPHRLERVKFRQKTDGGISTLPKKLGLNDDPPELLEVQARQAVEEFGYG